MLANVMMFGWYCVTVLWMDVTGFTYFLYSKFIAKAQCDRRRNFSVQQTMNYSN